MTKISQRDEKWTTRFEISKEEIKRNGFPADERQRSVQDRFSIAMPPDLFR